MKRRRRKENSPYAQFKRTSRPTKAQYKERRKEKERRELERLALDLMTDSILFTRRATDIYRDLTRGRYED